ncbi:MAG: site-specific integrase [Cytophagia bacterium]|jgi:site-specific recombinase XerD|nr:site-specific integrase [Cytophagia bacterium]
MASVRKIPGRSVETYVIDFQDPFTEIRKRKIFKGSKSNANAIAKELELKLHRIKNGVEGSIRSSAYLEEFSKYFEANSKKVKDEKSVIREMHTINVFLKYKQYGRRKLNSLRCIDIQNFVDFRLNSRKKNGEKLSPNTVLLDIRNLRVLFNFALKNMYIERSPMIGVIGPKKREKKIRFLTELEIKLLLDVIDKPEFRNLIATYLYTGARREELVPPLFSWSSVDFTNKQIQLTGKLDKTRYVPMNSKVEQILQEHKELGFEFPFNFKVDYVSHRLADYYNEAGIKDANVHVLRKTFGSLLIQKNLADIFVISKLLGHSSVRVTESHYVELLKENVEKPVEGLTDVILLE